MIQEEQKQNSPEALAQTPGNAVQKREQSSIQFPYGDLDGAIEIAKAIHAVGGQSCEIEQLAGYLRVQASGGGFRARLATPRIFGLVDNERGVIRLTALGRRVVDPSQEDAAKVEAFLAVPLYKAIYEEYRGYSLPATAALERELAKFGVANKQTDKARQAFERSARQAGFYWAGSDRLTLPVTKSQPRGEEIRIVEPAPVERRASPVQNVQDQPLEYRLVDLMDNKMPQDVKEAVWVLIRYLKDIKTADDP